MIFIKKYWLVILLAAILCTAGGCATQQERLLQKKQQDILESYREIVTTVVDDPVRARQLIHIGEKLNLEMKADTRVLLKTIAEIKKLNADYGTTREELQTTLQNLNDQRRNMREAILTARQEALSLTTQAEWEELMSRRGTLPELIQETPGIL
jgi:Glu-tRNA(Gln) amidotransferase subunit E-like FAD-binding protein